MSRGRVQIDRSANRAGYALRSTRGIFASPSVECHQRHRRIPGGPAQLSRWTAGEADSASDIDRIGKMPRSPRRSGVSGPIADRSICTRPRDIRRPPSYRPLLRPSESRQPRAARPVRTCRQISRRLRAQLEQFFHGIDKRLCLRPVRIGMQFCVRVVSSAAAGLAGGHQGGARPLARASSSSSSPSRLRNRAAPFEPLSTASAFTTSSTTKLALSSVSG